MKVGKPSLSLEARRKPGHGTVEQAAAICCRISDRGLIEILLITSRDTGRWVLPKGFIEKRETSYRAAQREALEEAGVVGKVRKKPVGHYAYLKDGQRHVVVAAHLLRCESQTKKFREQRQREMIWVEVRNAAEMVDEPELQTILILLQNSSPLTSQDRLILKQVALSARGLSGKLATSVTVQA